MSLTPRGGDFHSPEFVIHGPYGIPKGRHIGIRAFKNKLKLKGHEKYYALSGKTDSKLGFEARFEASSPCVLFTP